MALQKIQRERISDVMHTLSVIFTGQAHDPVISAKACWRVLDSVLELDRLEGEVGE